MVRFILVRHGLSKGNKEQRFSGQYDFPLTDTGVCQADAVCRHIYENFEVDRIYSSDLSRAYDTVKPLSEQLGMEITKRSDLREIDVGIWAGRFFTDVEKEFPEDLKKYKSNPGLWKFEGGESYSDMQIRSLSAIDEIASENDGKTVVIGTHGGVIRVLRAAWEGIPIAELKKLTSVANASVTIVEYTNGSVKWISLGETDHLTVLNEMV